MNARGGVAVRRLLSVAALALVPGLAVSQAPVQAGGSWEVPCRFDSSRALIPVICGRLKVPENPEAPARVIEVAFMLVKAP